MRITVIVPTYNELENLPGLVSTVFSLPLDLSLLVVDDNSPDGTGNLAEKLALEHPGRMKVMHRTGKLGFSSAYLEAMRLLVNEEVDAIGQMDADFSHQPEKLVEMAQQLEMCDMVLGSRYVTGGSTDLRWPVWRKILSAWGSFYARGILGIPLHDLTGGFRMWRRETLKAMPLGRVQSRGYVFQVEMVYLAWCLKFKVCEVPIYFAERRLGKSKMSFRIQVEAAFRVWQVLWAYRDLRRLGLRGRLA